MSASGPRGMVQRRRWPLDVEDIRDPYEALGQALQAVVEHAVTTALTSLPTQVSDAPAMLSVAEAAKQLGVGTTKVKQLIAAGRLSSVSIGRRRLVPMASIRIVAGESPT